MNLTNQRDLEHNKISESTDKLRAYIEVKGTSYNATDTGAGYINFSKTGSSVLTTNSVGSRGLAIAIIDHTTMELIKAIRVYDVYAYDSERNLLADELNQIHNMAYGNVIYCLSSFDAVNTNSNLATAMQNARAYQWSNLPGLSLGPTHRNPYAAIGTSSLGIIKETLHSNAAGADAAFVSMSVSTDWLSIGSEGYGPDLALGSHLSEYNYAGTAYSFRSYGWTIPSTGYLSIKDDEYIRMTGQQKIDRTRLYAGGSVYSYFWSASDNNGWIAAASHGSTSTEWEEFEIYFKWNKARDTAAAGGEAKYLRVGHYHMPNNIDDGTSSIRNITYQKCGFNPNPTSEVNIQESVITAKSISEGIGFKLTDPNSYYTLWNSAKNLTGNPNLGDSRYGSGFDTESVRWFDRTLTNRNEYSIHEGKNFTGDSNRYSETGYVNIDSSKMYVGLIWQNCQQKTSGTNYLGTHTQNTSYGSVPTYSFAGTANTTNPYSMYPSGNNIEKDTWQLWSYWFLPYWFTDAQSSDFYSKYRGTAFGNYEFGRAGNPNIGNPPTLGPSAMGGNIPMSRFQQTDGRIHLRWLDYYNGSGQSHKTWWALPGIFEVDPMGIQSDGKLFSWNIKEM